MSDPPGSAEPDEAFWAAREEFESLLSWLDGDASSGLEHAEVERQFDIEGRERLRLLLQDHLDLRALREIRVEVAGSDGTSRGRIETGHTRALATIFGQVTVTRIAYRQPRPGEPAPNRCGVEPAAGEAFPRAAAASRDRELPGILRRRSGSHRTQHRPTPGEAAG